MKSIKNTKFENFVKITLRGNPENKFTLPGKQIIKLILGMLREERLIVLDEMRELIRSELDKAEYSSEMATWKGAEIDEQVFEGMKKKILFRVNEKLKGKK